MVLKEAETRDHGLLAENNSAGKLNRNLELALLSLIGHSLLHLENRDTHYNKPSKWLDIKLHYMCCI